MDEQDKVAVFADDALVLREELPKETGSAGEENPLHDANPLNADKCSSCKMSFKTADRVIIENQTNNKFHMKCYGDGKDRLGIRYVGVHKTKGTKFSSISLDRFKRRLKKLARDVKRIKKA